MLMGVIIKDAAASGSEPDSPYAVRYDIYDSGLQFCANIVEECYGLPFVIAIDEMGFVKATNNKRTIFPMIEAPNSSTIYFTATFFDGVIFIKAIFCTD